MTARPASLLAGALALLATTFVPAPPASATSPYLEIPPKEVAEASAAYRYAQMTEAEALAELDRRKVPYRRLKRVAGVRTPVRLTGRLHGVDIHGALPKEQRENSMFEIVDARFLLALDDFARLLAKHDIVEVVHFTMYRPNGPKPGSKEEKEYFKRLREREAKARGDVPRSKPRRGAAKRGAGKRTAKPKATKPKASKPRRAKPKAGKPGNKTRRKGTRSKGSKPAGRKHSERLPSHSIEHAHAATEPHHGRRSIEHVHAEPYHRCHGIEPMHVDAATEPHHGSHSIEHVHASTGSHHSMEPLPTHAGEADELSVETASSEKAKRAASKQGSGKRRGTKRRTTKRRTTKATKRSGRKHSTKARGSKRRQGKHRPKPIRKKLWAPPGTRHPAGLAIDVGILVKRDGRRLGVAQHFRGHIGAQTCGPKVPAPATAEARELRSLVCEARDLGIFTYVLTPNYDRAHADHFHMEIRSGVRWFLYH